MEKKVYEGENMREKIAEILKECQNTPGLEPFTSKPDEVTIEEDPLFLDGYSSHIVRLRASDGSTMIAKHSPPFARAFGDAMPLPQMRAELEMTGLQLLQRYIPGAAPKPFFFSVKHFTTLMEDLVGYKILQSELIAGNVNKAVIGTVAVNMAKLHRSTHKYNISTQEWTELEEILSKFHLVMERLPSAFKSCLYINDPKDEVSKKLKHIADIRVYGDSKLNQVIDQFADDFTFGNECLTHGDNHTQNMLVKGDDIKMTDLEIVRLGKCNIDVAELFWDLLLTYYYHLVSTEDADSHRQIAQKIKDCTYHLVNTYFEHMSWSSGERIQNVTKFMKDLAASIGCLIFYFIAMGVRTYLGASQIPLFEAGIRLMEQHQEVDSVDKIYSILALD